ncbi:hypothetical protein [Bacteroides uniformis]
MRFIMFIYLKTTSMKINWKSVVLYVIRILELVLTGVAGGAASNLL